MRIITSADDFGENEDCTRATIDCIEAGALAGATIMAKMPATEMAVAYAKSRPDLSWGVHLTYIRNTCERPVCDPKDIPALVGPDGMFMDSQKVRLMALFNQIPIDQAARVIEAQVGLLLDRGLKISHVDSHGHLHKFGPIRKALELVLPKLGISRVRSVQDVYIRKPYKSFTYWFGPVQRQRIRAAFDTTDAFYMPSSAWDTDWEQPLLDRLPHLNAQTIEVGVHPGYSEGWRDYERRSILKFAQLARDAGHTLMGWKDLPTRKQPPNAPLTHVRTACPTPESSDAPTSDVHAGSCSIARPHHASA